MERAGFEKADVAKRLMGGGVDEVLVSFALSIVSVGMLGIAYFIGQDCIDGQSLGRRAVGQRLVSLKTGETATPVEAAVRNAIGFLVVASQVGALIDLLLVILHPEGRRVGDLVVGTQVVDVAPAAAPHPSPAISGEPTPQTF